MNFREEKRGYRVVLEVGDEIISSLSAFAEGLCLSGFFWGIGALNDAELGWFDIEKKEYVRKVVLEQCEILSLSGNISKDESENTIVHGHVILGRKDFGCIGGHLFRGVVSVTCEIFFEPTSQINRSFDPKTGLKLWSIDKGVE